LAVQKFQNFAWTTFGRYALMEKIGSGGMAEIYRGKTFGAAGFEKQFAVKLILPNLVDDDEFVEMFINEAKITVSLYHANIVQVFDLGEHNGQYFIAMEYVHGKDLLDVLARCAHRDLKIPLDILLFVMMEALKGLNFAHCAKDPFGEPLKVIHRDVSPSNILISYAGDVKIGDFGVAKAAFQRTLTDSGTLKGKVGYMSPEQVVGEVIDYRSDIFSAGIVFLEALSMNRLFVGGSDLDVMLRVRDADIVPNLIKAGPVPDELETIARSALARHREERFQSAGDFYQALLDFCFRHRIQVTGTDLSNFMRMIFAEEIEDEKQRRRTHLSHGGQPSKVVAQPTRSPGQFEIVEPTDPDAQEAYHYRDASGRVLGPMDRYSLIEFLQDRRPESDDRVSVDGCAWKSVADFPELEGKLSTTQDKVLVAPAAKNNWDLGGDTVRDGGEYVPSNQAGPVEEAAKALEEISLGLWTSDTDAEVHTGFERTETEVEGVAVEATQPPSAARQDILELKSQYASYEGNLRDTEYAFLLARLHRIKATGRLFVQEGAVGKSIFFESGEPILIVSNNPKELLGYLLVSRGIISEDALQAGLARLSEWGGRLGDALVAEGAIPAHDIFLHLTDQMREKLLDVYTWTDGTFGYFENQEPDLLGYPLGINAYSITVEGCLNRVGQTRIDRFLEARKGRPIIPTNRIPLDVLSLSSKALRVAKQSIVSPSVQDLRQHFDEASLPFVNRILYLLHQVEFLSVGDETETLLG
jgi:eukaryotic-like serine/threonine-protein kinase